MVEGQWCKGFQVFPVFQMNERNLPITRITWSLVDFILPDLLSDSTGALNKMWYK